MTGKPVALMTGVVALLLALHSPVRAADLEEYIQEALENNPSLAALKHRWESYTARVPQAGALDDPMFRFEASNLPLSSFDYDSTPMTGNQFVLSQKLPFPGTLAAKEEAAQAANASAEALFLDRKLSVVNMTKQAYFTLAFLDRAIDITEKNEALLRDFVRIAQTKYSVGRGLQQDVLKAQVSLSALKNRLIRLRTMRRTAAARLNLVLNRSPETPVARPQLLAMTTLDATTDTASTELARAALANRPLLKSYQSKIQQFDAMAEVARKQLWPNLSFSLGYRQRAFMPGDPVQGSDFLSFGVGLNLPIYRGRKQHQKIAEANAQSRMTESQLEATRQQILTDVRTMLLEVRRHSDQAELFRTAILPQAEQSLQSALSGYQVDKVDFLTLLNNQMSLFNFEIDYYRHVSEHEKQLAELEAVVGKRLY